jgi:hypothetical protein
MSDTRWKSYEEVATYLLGMFAKEFGLLRVDGKQSVEGKRSGTSYVIDAKAIPQGNETFLIVECRRYTTAKQNQEKVGALAYRIIDTGAEGAIIVSPLGLQSGAQKVADAENIMHVTLHEDSTPTEFAMQLLNKTFVGVHERLTVSDKYEATVMRTCEKCGKRFVVLENKRACTSCSVTK